MDIEILREIGLTEGEIKVYLALLKIGSSTSGPITDESGVSRSKIYHVLDKLMKKGLASYITKEKTKFYQAAEPKKILDYIDEKEKKLAQNKGVVEKLLPELVLQQAMAKKSEINVYSGLKGMITAHEHTYLKLKKGEFYYYLGIYAYQPKEHHFYWQRDHKRREKVGINCRLIFNADTDPKVLKNRNNFKGCEARFMPTDIKTPSGILIYKDTTTIIIQHPSVISIEIINQEVADSFMAYAEEYWKKSKPFNK